MSKKIWKASRYQANSIFRRLTTKFCYWIFFLLFTYLKDCLNQIDATMLVVCSPATQLKRLTQPPRAIAPELALARMVNQQRRMPLTDIRLKVNWVIKHDCSNL